MKDFLFDDIDAMSWKYQRISLIRSGSYMDLPDG